MKRWRWYKLMWPDWVIASSRWCTSQNSGRRSAKNEDRKPKFSPLPIAFRVVKNEESWILPSLVGGLTREDIWIFQLVGCRRSLWKSDIWWVHSERTRGRWPQKWCKCEGVVPFYEVMSVSLRIDCRKIRKDDFLIIKKEYCYRVFDRIKPFIEKKIQLI